MFDANDVEINVKDIVEELKEENNRLLNELLFAQKMFESFENFKNNLKNINCNCDQNIGNNYILTDFNNQYKALCEQSEDILIKFKDNFYEKKIEENIKQKLNQNIFLSNNENFEEMKLNFNKKLKDIRKLSEDLISDLNCIQTNDNSNTNKTKVLSIKKPSISQISNQNILNFKCKKCERKFSNRFSVMAHMRIHNNIFKCLHCSFTTKFYKELTFHKKTHLIEKHIKTDNNNKEEPVVDLITFKNFITPDGQEEWLCEYPGCELKFNSNSDIINHNDIVHKEDQQLGMCDFDETSKLFKCKYCSLATNNLIRYVKHKSKHLNRKIFRCDWPGCESKFPNKSSLKDHQSCHEGHKNWFCDWPECGQSFRTKPNLKKHYWIHTDERHYKCEWPGCETTFRIRSSLNRHRKSVHQTGEQLFCQWPNCAKSFWNSQNLKEHMRRHTGEKPFVCPFIGCDMRFVSSKNRKTHFNQIHVNKS